MLGRFSDFGGAGRRLQLHRTVSSREFHDKKEIFPACVGTCVGFRQYAVCMYAHE